VFILGLMMGWLSTRYRDDRILLWAAGISTVGLLGFAFTGSLALVFVCNFLSGAAFVIIRSSSYAYASRLIPAMSRGRQFALFNATFFLSWGTAGTLVTGPIVDSLVRSGSTEEYAYRVSFFAAAVLVMIGIVVLALVSRIEKPEIEA
jgi:MFS family permease